MKELIQSYRASQASLRDKIHQLNEILGNKRLSTKEKRKCPRKENHSLQ